MREIAGKKTGRRVNRPYAIEITLTPLIDAVLVLLIIFMVAMPIMQNMIQVELPTSSTNDDASALEPVTVYLDKNKTIFIEEQKTSPDSFLKDLENTIALRGGGDQVVMIKADQSVSYGDVVHMVDDIKYLGGVRYVALATEKYSKIS